MTRIGTTTLTLLYTVWAPALTAEDITLFIVVNSVRIEPLDSGVIIVVVDVRDDLK